MHERACSCWSLKTPGTSIEPEGTTPVAESSQKHLMDSQSHILLQRWKNGDHAAATEIFNRFACRLVALARTRMDESLQSRLDPSDVVQSAYGSFFRRAAEGAFEIDDGGDLWQLLATITVNKLRKKYRFHTAQKRSIHQEAGQSEQSRQWEAIQTAVTEPTPHEALTLIEMLDDLLETLDVPQRQIVEMRLAGWNVADIAMHSARTERTVRRVVNLFGKRLEHRMSDDAPDD